VCDLQGDFLINDWLVQPQINMVEKGGKHWHLEPKVMQVLVHLALHPNQVLSKERLIEAIWRDTFVGDDVLVRCVSEIRYVFGDDARSPSVIQTIPKAGYRLIASVTMEVPAATALTSSSTARFNGLLRSEKKHETHPQPHELEDSLGVDDLPGHNSFDVSSTGDPGGAPSHESRSEIHVSDSAIGMSNHGTESRGRSTFFHYFPWVLAAVSSLTLLIWAGAYYWRSIHPTPFDVFWAPILKTQEPALFCVADQNQYSFITLRDAAEPARKVTLKDNLSAVVIDDLDTIVRVAGALRARGKQYLLKGEERTSLSDLRSGPSIFIGAFDNAWTLRLTHSLRYRFANDTEMTQFRIIDANDPSKPGWIVDRTQQMATNNYKDFAIVARFTDANTDRPTVIVAGVGRGGTIAAGEFLTDPEDLAQLLRAVQAAGNKKNMEIVLSTQIIDGQPGSPKVEASYFW